MPDRDPDGLVEMVQVLAFALDQLTTTSWPAAAEDGLTEMLAVGGKATATGGVTVRLTGTVIGSPWAEPITVRFPP